MIARQAVNPSSVSRLIVSPARKRTAATAVACMSAASVGLSVGAGAGSLPTHHLLIPDLPPQTRPPLFPLLSRWNFFLRAVYAAARLCRFHPRVYGDTRPPPFLSSARLDPVNVSKQQFPFNLTSIFSIFQMNIIDIRGGYVLATSKQTSKGSGKNSV